MEATHIIEGLGAERIKAMFGAADRTIRHAQATGRFAAGWYGPLKKACDEAGIECPMEAFNWKSPEQQPARAG